MPVPNAFAGNTEIKSALVNANNTFLTNLLDDDSVDSTLGDLKKEIVGNSVQPRARLRDSSLGAISTATATVINFDTEDYDIGDIHAGGNPSRMTFANAGRYLFAMQFAWPANTSGIRFMDLRVDGTQVRFKATASVDGSVGLTFRHAESTILDIAAGEYVEWRAFQNSGGDLTPVSGEFENFIVVQKLVG